MIVMTNRQLRQYEMLYRVSKFGEAHRDRFPESGLAGRAITVVTDAVKRLRDRAVARMAMRQESARERREARAALMAMLESISRTARVVGRRDPTLPTTFRLPERES